ncbi:MAG: TldD/PmbA family protein [Deltaproteobacteria bacterium]|nr:TldD/PmbA family protein [Deltaproteobacteria bacterium]
MSQSSLKKRVAALKLPVEYWSIRCVQMKTDTLCARQGVLNPPCTTSDRGFLVTVLNEGGVGYAATPDDSHSSLQAAFESAMNWARISGKYALFEPKSFPRTKAHGSYGSPVKKAFSKMSLARKVQMLKEVSSELKFDERIVDWSASLMNQSSAVHYINSDGAYLEQEFNLFQPDLSATAHTSGQTQTRTLSGHGVAKQSGLELLEEIHFEQIAKRVAEEALELVMAENCPSGARDLLLAPDQMMLQIHESIGHPLELDRILGDERNYAGTSFVKPDMFGKYQYGSKLLNVTFDPAYHGELASYSYDDDGARAQKAYLIRDGLLKRPLGGLLSQARADMLGVSNSRASNWNRPPIDRIANVNVEPGDSSLEDMISQVEKGIYMKSNLSWSIDDSRNKFQFGCEWAQLIENGRLTRVVRNPNYRGISANFWRNLTAVGNKKTNEVYGSMMCGKGEPNQAIHVGHASPACLFKGVDVFGGQK